MCRVPKGGREMTELLEKVRRGVICRKTPG